MFHILSDILPVITDLKLKTNAAATIEFYLRFTNDILPFTGTLTLDMNFT